MICKRAKKNKRMMNKVMRALNDNILNDNLWRGRFVARMKAFHYKWYEDGSGISCRYAYEFKDLKTGHTRIYYFDGLDVLPLFQVHIYHTMNHFIVEECDVWRVDKNSPDYPYNDKTVYRKR